MHKVSSDINKITQACTAAQENTAKLIENAILQALTKPQDIIPHYPARDCRTFGANQDSYFPYDTNWTVSWQTNNFGMQQHPSNVAYLLQRPYEAPVSPDTHVDKQPPNTSFLISL